MKNIIFYFFLISIIPVILNGECDSSFSYYSELPPNVTILVGDSCLADGDISVLDSLILINDLEYETPLNIGTQTWFNGRLKFFVAGNYGNSSGVNDTIYSLPENFGDLDNLASLYLEWNRISMLPESFKNLTGLISFYINNNTLSQLGDSLGNLSNLFFLDLGYNQLLSLPESICELNNLSYLWLFNNNLEYLPTCFCDMELEWNDDDPGGYPYFAIGENALCDSVPGCVSESENFELSLDQFYYSFPVYAPQDCDQNGYSKVSLPYQFRISQAYPNPFNPETKLLLEIPYDRKIDIKVFDILGNLVEVIYDNKLFTQGNHMINWSGKNKSSGLYILQIKDGINTEYRKLSLLK
tara:strand:- start:1089 stop:2153 length:1065 start_codon:yes stop_codon:yes gene_type:complete